MSTMHFIVRCVLPIPWPLQKKKKRSNNAARNKKCAPISKNTNRSSKHDVIDQQFQLPRAQLKLPVKHKYLFFSDTIIFLNKMQIKTWIFRYLILLFPKMIRSALVVLLPMMLFQLTNWRTCLAFIALSILSTLLENMYNYKSIMFRNEIFNLLSNQVFAKMTQLNIQSNQVTKGEALNIMSNDVNRITYLLYSGTDVICCIVTLATALIALYSYVGFYGTLIASGTMLLGMPFMYWAQTRQNTAIMEKDKLEDLRVNAVQDMLANIKYVKLFVWEKLFASRMEESRQAELDCCMKCQTGGIAVNLIFQVNQLIATTVCLAWYNGVLGHQLDAASAYALLSLISALNDPLYSVPDMIVDLTQAKASVVRVREFLQKKSVPANQFSTSSDCDFELVNTTWKNDPESDKIRLAGSISISSGELVAVVGKVGSGKTTLLSALAGELFCTSGSCKKQPKSIALVSQQAWIRNCSARENILLNKEFDQKMYNKVVKACCLETDFSHLPDGDSTLVGEKGVTLSGGQKARLQLARAIYQDADVYLLDDILASVDATVGKHLLEQVIFGLLQSKTRVLATHHTHFLNKCDKIAIMNDCQIVQSAAPSQVEQSKVIEELANDEQDENETAIDKDAENDDESEAESESENDMKDPSLRSASVWEYIGSYSKVLIAIFIALMGIDNMCDLYQDRWVQQWSDDDDNSSSWQYYLKWYIAIVVANAVARFSMRYLGFVMSTGTAKKYHEKVLNKVTHASLRELEFMPTGKIVNQLTSKLSELDYGYMQQDVRDQIDSSISFVITLFTILYYHPWVLLFLVPVAYASYKIQQNAQQTIIEGRQMCDKSYDNVLSLFGEAFDGITAVRSMNAVDFMKQAFDTSLQTRRKYFLKQCYFDYLVLPTQMELISSILVVASAIMGAGNLLVIRQSEKLSGNLQSLVSSLTDTESSMLTLVSFQKFFGLKQEQYDSALGHKLNASNGEIVFQNVSLKYNLEHEPVLKDLTFSIPSKKRTAICGRTAAGKTSLITAMMRLRELVEGTITIDNQDIAQVDLESLRASFGILPQDAYLPAGLLRTALDPNNAYQDEAIAQALKQVSLDNFSPTMQLAENASNISHGEKQLLCMARALLTKRKIIILDEATASVDKQTDQKIQATLKTEFTNCTIITIAHRLNTIMDYDNVLVMENGRVVEQGNPLKLSIMKDSKFADMLSKQHD